MGIILEDFGRSGQLQIQSLERFIESGGRIDLVPVSAAKNNSALQIQLQCFLV